MMAQTTKLSKRLGQVFRTVSEDTDTLLSELTIQFINDAKIIDPSIRAGWVCSTMMLEGRPPGGAVASIVFDRAKDPTFRSGTA